MDLSNISLAAITSHTPDEFLSSDAIEARLAPVYDRLKLPFGRIEMQTGIKTRGIYHNKMPSDIASMAAKKLFRENNINPADVDLLIHASVCRDFLEPSTASVIHSHLKLSSKCFSFDLSNACLGVVNAITVAAQMINAGAINNALIVTGENATPLIENTIKTILEDESLTRKSIKKFFANFTIGSSGVALFIKKGREGLASFNLAQSLTDSSAHTLCQGDGSMDGLVMETNSEELLRRGVSLAKKNWDEFIQKLKTTEESFSHYICHQVGIQHQKYLYEILGLNFEKDHSTFETYGNTGSAALPLTLNDAISQRKFKSGESIALLGIGSGLHTTMLGMKWN